MSVTKFQTHYNFKETDSHHTFNSGEILVDEVHSYYINDVVDILIASEQAARQNEKLYYEMKGSYSDIEAEDFSATAHQLSRAVFGSDIMEICDTLMTSKQIAANYQRNRNLFVSILTDTGVDPKVANGYYDAYRDDIIKSSKSGNLAEFLQSKGIISKIEPTPAADKPQE